MISINELIRMKSSCPRTGKKDDLIDISGIEISGETDQAMRIAKYIEDVGNPYMFKVGEIAVGLEFDPLGNSMGEAISAAVVNAISSQLS